MAAGEVYTVEPFGKYTLVTVAPGEERIRVKTERRQPKAGEPSALRLQTERLDFFDPQTGGARDFKSPMRFHGRATSMRAEEGER